MVEYWSDGRMGRISLFRDFAFRNPQSALRNRIGGDHMLWIMYDPEKGKMAECQ
jgi:hypothetical protein